MNHFVDYSNAVFDAFLSHAKKREIVERKQEIIDGIREHTDREIASILFVGFNPAVLTVDIPDVSVTEVSDRTYQWIKQENPRVKFYDGVEPKKFDAIIALDEYLTFAATEDSQKSLITNLCMMTNKVLVTTVKDYKNQNFKEREYSQPAIIRSGNTISAYTEIHDWSMTDKNSWISSLYCLSGPNADCLGQFDRRTLFFKQLAKFTADAGARNFAVHANLMHKSLIKKNYEHVISIAFDR